MKKIGLLIFGIFLSCNSSQKTVTPGDGSNEQPSQTNESVEFYAETISESELKEHLYTYASDEFQGRETGAEGQKKAIAYIKKQYQELGIAAAKKDGDYFQKVPLEIGKLPSGTITINDRSYSLETAFLAFSGLEKEYSEIVYCGYGIEEGEYSDYSGLDVDGKIVLMKFGEPIAEDGSYVLSGGTKKSDWSNMSEALGKRTQIAKDKGARAILYYDMGNYGRYENYFDYRKKDEGGSMEIINEADKFNTILLGNAMAKAILPEIDNDSKPRILNSGITFNLKSNNDLIDTENVVAILPGSEKPNEYIIISSHLDHIGVTDDGEIYNGADDDGSGTVAMLEIAEAFKIAADKGNGPKRSIVFLHVTGEEKGLLGSKYYTDFDPIFPLNQTVANLNIDMIGRIDPKREGDRNYVYLIGSDKLSTDLHKLSEEINNKYTGLELDYKYNDEKDPNRFYFRSDHYNFAKNNIPIIFYFNGTHEDYHKTGDTPDKINYDLLENRSRLIFHTAWAVANRDQRVIVDKASK